MNGLNALGLVIMCKVFSIKSISEFRVDDGLNRQLLRSTLMFPKVAYD